MTNFLKYLIAISIIMLAYTGYKSYVVIDGKYKSAFYAIWPILSFVAIVVLWLLPCVNTLIDLYYDQHIEQCKQRMWTAEENAKKAQISAQRSISKIRSECEKKISEAHDKERIAARNELDNEWSNYHHKHNDVTQRESNIASREQKAEQMINDVKRYAIMLNEENERLKRTAQNASHAYQRKQRQLDRK